MTRKPPPMPWIYRIVAVFLFILLVAWIALVMR
jgi:hypothetical protein